MRRFFFLVYVDECGVYTLFTDHNIAGTRNTAQTETPTHIHTQQQPLKSPTVVYYSVDHPWWSSNDCDCFLKCVLYRINSHTHTKVTSSLTVSSKDRPSAPHGLFFLLWFILIAFYVQMKQYLVPVATPLACPRSRPPSTKKKKKERQHRIVLKAGCYALWNTGAALEE